MDKRSDSVLQKLSLLVAPRLSFLITCADKPDRMTSLPQSTSSFSVTEKPKFPQWSAEPSLQMKLSQFAAGIHVTHKMSCPKGLSRSLSRRLSVYF